MTLRVRRARVEDAEALHALYHAAYSVHADPTRPPTMGLKDTVESVRATLRDQIVLVAEDADGRLTGTVAIRPVANVRRLATAPDRQREGVASRLLAAAEEEARRAGFAQVWLDTIPDHPWLPDYYLSRGYEDRSVETLPDGTRWRVFRKLLRPFTRRGK